ncbi:MAG: zf-HC2 domain-containing protein [Methylococcus sp.]
MSTLQPHPSKHAHEDILTRLPWLANGSLDAEERLYLEAHLEVCMSCRQELSALRALAENLGQHSMPVPDAHAAFDRLKAQMSPRPIMATRNASPGMERTRSKPRPRLAVRGRHRYIPLAMAATILMAVLIAPFLTQWDELTEPSFHTLSDRVSLLPGAPGDLRLVFDSELTRPAIDRLLREVGAEVIGEPGVGGIYTVRLSGSAGAQADPAAAMAYLRKQAGVVLVEVVTTQ